MTKYIENFHVVSARWLLVDVGGEEVKDPTRGGWEMLEIRFSDGRTAVLDSEQKLLEAGVPGVYLTGPDDFTDFAMRFTVPGSVRPQTMRCVTGNQEVLRLVREFMDAVVAGTITPMVVYRAGTG
jgi:hypothetical protein